MLRSRHARPAPRPRRSGFTLLEVLLAAVIATFLLAGLYMAMNMTMQQTQATRNAVESEDLSRGIFNKMTVDLSGTLSPLPPKCGGNSAGSGGAVLASSAGTTTPSATTTPAAPTGSTTGAASSASAPATTTPTNGTSTTTTPGATDNATAVSAAAPVQGGIDGQTEKQLVIYTARVPEVFGRFSDPIDQTQVRADQRQIIYWLGAGGGLYRQERPWVTASNISNEPDISSPDAILIAEEVTDLTFEYFDGTSWLTTWDGTTAGPDGVTPLGPPRAIRVTVVFKIPIGGGEFNEKSVSQVIPVRAAPGTFTPTFIEAPTDGATGTATDPTTGAATGGATGGTTTGGAATGGATGGGATGGATGGGAAMGGGGGGGGATGGKGGGK